MRVLFPEHGRYTKKGVRGFYSSKEREVHLVYPAKIGNPFNGGGLIEDSIEHFTDITGLDVTWTPVNDKFILNDSKEFSSWEEVLV